MTFPGSAFFREPPPALQGRVSASAEQKFRQAMRHRAAIVEAITDWQAKATMRVTAGLVDDGYAFEVRTRVEPPLNLNRQAHLLGDFVHNLRSSLNHLVMDLARDAGAEEREIARLEYPNAKTEREWRKARRKLAAIPDHIVERIRRLQPFTDRAIDGTTSQDYIERSVINTLIDYDNDDKHRTSLSCLVYRSENRSQPNVIWQEDERGAERALPLRPTIDSLGMEYTDFSHLNTDVYFRYHSTRPITWSASPLRVKFQILASSERRPEHTPLIPLVGMLAIQVRFNLDAVYYGPEAARDRSEQSRFGRADSGGTHWDRTFDAEAIAGISEEARRIAAERLRSRPRQDS